MLLRKTIGAACAVGLLGVMLGPSPVDSSFTYQGVLADNNVPVDGTADLSFFLFDTAVAGVQIGAPVDRLNTPVVSGMFAVTLDFGVDALNGDRRWLEIRARTPAGGGNYEIISPRQPLHGSPYAIQARGIHIDETNRVGIGTTSPVALMHIDASNSSNLGIQVDAPGGSTGTVVLGGPGGSPGFQGYANNGNRRDIRFSDGGINIITNSAASTPSSLNGIFIGENGRVGIGTTAPTAALTLTTGAKLSLDDVADHRAVYVPAGENDPLVLSNHAFAGNPTIRFRDANSGEDTMTIDIGDQRVGIGTDAPSYPLHVDSDAEYSVFARGTGAAAILGQNESLQLASTGVFGSTVAANGFGMQALATSSNGSPIGVYSVSNSPGGWDFFANGAGVDYGGNSSIRWKRNIEAIPDPLGKLDRIRGVYFDWDEDHGGHHDVGMIAEEVGAVLPEVVVYEENGVDAMGMDYSKTTPLLVEAIKAVRIERDKRLGELEAENASLRARLDAMETLVERLAAQSGALVN